MIFSTQWDSNELIFGWDSVIKRVGGPILISEDDAVQLRVLVDHSAVEIFTGTGETLTTRCASISNEECDSPSDLKGHQL